MGNFLTFLKGYRTFIASGLMILCGVLAQTDWVSFLNDPRAGSTVIASGFIMAFMRYITTTPPGQAESGKPEAPPSAPLYRDN